MTILLIRVRQLGGHIHCRVFTSKMFGGTYAKVGELTFDEREWPDIVRIFDNAKYGDHAVAILKHEDEA